MQGQAVLRAGASSWQRQSPTVPPYLSESPNNLLPCHDVMMSVGAPPPPVSPLQVIAIDEGQFFPDLVEFCQEAVDHFGKHVIVAGLSGGWGLMRGLLQRGGHLICSCYFVLF